MGLGPDVSYSHASKIYTKQQPDGTTLNGTTVVTEEVLDAGSVSQVYGLQTINGQILPVQITFSFAKGAANVSNVTIQVTDNAGNAVTQTDGKTPQVFHLDISLAKSDGTVTNLTPSTGLGVSTGTLLNTYVAGKALYVETDATGKAVVTVTDTGKQGFYIMVQAGCQPLPTLSRQMTSNDYT